MEDGLDACPTAAGPKGLHGCPDRDSDGDGVLDRLDNCPTEAGPASNQGCPESAPQLVVLTPGKLVIKEKVFFGTGSAAVLPRSQPLLAQVARVLVAHPELTAVRVEGHTDDRGDREQNLTLSHARAEAVKAALIARGVAPERLTARGYGPDRAAVSNETGPGREQNRRVEFILTP